MTHVRLDLRHGELSNLAYPQITVQIHLQIQKRMMLMMLLNNRATSGTMFSIGFYNYFLWKHRNYCVFNGARPEEMIASYGVGLGPLGLTYDIIY
ncbi:hypothetical protein ACJX0J_016383, partial [Zea mays]